MYFKTPISDVHIHVRDKESLNSTMRAAYELDYEKIVLLSMAFAKHGKANNVLLAAAKLAMPEKCYAFAGCHYPEIGFSSGEEMLRQVKLYHKLGFDGIKMLDGKPNFRATIGEPLDSVEYDPMFSYLEENDIPLLYHINDPWEFWQWDMMPDWAKAHGRDSGVYYGEGKAPSKEQIEDETLGFLAKHPKLNIIIPHFFFVAHKYDYAVEVMEKYPNLQLDITPGWEMFESFAEDYDKWRAFFVTYADRIFYGTDLYSDHFRETVLHLRNALETDKEFVAFEEKCKGLKLDDDVLQKIYHDNFERYLPFKPRKIDVEGIREYVEWVKEDIALLSTEELRNQNLESLKEAVDCFEENYYFHVLSK